MIENKVICFVGGTGLIGSAGVESLRAAGATVYAGSRHSEIPIDISDGASIHAFINEVIRKEGRIDVWINCAFPHQEYTYISLERIDKDEMLNDIDSHVLGYFDCCRHAMVAMRRQGHGNIINFGSIYGEMVPDFRMYEDTEIKKTPTYFLIKASVHMLTKYFARIGAPDIRVNTIAPGGVEDQHSDIFKRQYSDYTPMGRMADTGDITGCILFLSSDMSRYITGQTLFVDGGFTL